MGKANLFVSLSFSLSLMWTFSQPSVLAQNESEGWSPELALKVKGIRQVQVAPDGSKMAFVVAEAMMEGETSEWRSQIHVAGADGAGSFQLTRGEGSATSPSWSPDGRWLVFLSSRGGEQVNLWRISVDGGEAQPLTDEKGGISSFALSPDGSRIAFLMAEPEGEEEKLAKKEKRDALVVDENFKMTDLYFVPMEPSKKDGEETRPVQKLTRIEYSIGGVFGGNAINWSPDGKTIVFYHQPTPKVNDWPKSDLTLGPAQE